MVLAPRTTRCFGSLSRRRALRLAALSAATPVGATTAGQGVAAHDASPTAASVPPGLKGLLHAAQADRWHYVLSNVDN